MALPHDKSVRGLIEGRIVDIAKELRYDHDHMVDATRFLAMSTPGSPDSEEWARRTFDAEKSKIMDAYRIESYGGEWPDVRAIDPKKEALSCLDNDELRSIYEKLRVRDKGAVWQIPEKREYGILPIEDDITSKPSTYKVYEVTLEDVAGELKERFEKDRLKVELEKRLEGRFFEMPRRTRRSAKPWIEPPDPSDESGKYEFTEIRPAKRRPWIVSFGVGREHEKSYKISIKPDGSCGCSCSAWKFAKRPKPDCKHIKALKADKIMCENIVQYFEDSPVLYKNIRWADWGWATGSAKTSVGTKSVKELLDEELDKPDFLAEIKKNARWVF